MKGRHRIPVIHQTGLDGRTRDMIFSVPELVARISAVCLTLPGNLIFTASPPGRGWAGSHRNPRWYDAGEHVRGRR